MTVDYRHPSSVSQAYNRIVSSKMDSMPRIKYSQAALNVLSHRQSEISVKVDNGAREIKLHSASTKDLKSIYQANK